MKAIKVNRKIIVGAGIALGLGASAVAFGILAYGALKDLSHDLDGAFFDVSELDEEYES